MIELYVKQKNLMTYLEVASSASIYDEEQLFYLNEFGEGFLVDSEPNADIKFSYPNITLESLRREFSDEAYTINLNQPNKYENYCSEIRTKLTELLSRFKVKIVGRLEMKIRTDFRLNCLDYFEVDYLDDEFMTKTTTPIVLVLTQDQIEGLPLKIQKEISGYFTFQEDFIKTQLIDLKRFSKENKKRAYNKGYRYEYFKFDSSKVGKRSSMKECAETFFKSLFDEGYIGGVDCVNNLSLYFDDKDPLSQSKVTWKTGGQELYYLLSTLGWKGYIKNARGSLSNNIIKIFIKEDGLDFTQDELYSRHTSKKAIASLSKIIRLLVQ